MTITLIDIAMGVAGLSVGALLLWPRLINAPLWRATITPLASIIGSGFLILGPILTDRFGSWGVLAMGLLCFAGYAFGSAIRYNIRRLEEPDHDGPFVDGMERVASWALALAYLISVAYYLNLFGAFAARIFGGESGFLGRVITTLAYVVILGAGITKGFSLLERMEQLTVSIKLAVIAALLGALMVHASHAWSPQMLSQSVVRVGPLQAVQLMFGLIVTVQGFETSRYLGSHYSPEIRQRSMRLSQWIATAIYVIYVALLVVSFRSGSFKLDETAIIDMMAGISAILGPLLILAALSAQFSAAVADTGGSGGLVTELTHGQIGAKGTYIAVAVVGLTLTWVFDVFQIVSYASRAFAFYYSVQSAIAAIRAWRAPHGARHMGRVTAFWFLAVLGIAAAIFGTAVES